MTDAGRKSFDTQGLVNREAFAGIYSVDSNGLFEEIKLRILLLLTCRKMDTNLLNL